MNDLTALPRGEARGRGKVSIQYTDALTGKVLEEIRGENHVFTPQLTATTGFQTTAMKADLLLCQGGSYPYRDGKMTIPFIPGEPIGYGRPNLEGTGTFRGTYRSAESWLGRVSRSKVSAKYVYDFLPTQAPGRVDWVGLTAALGTGVSTPAYAAPWAEFSSGARIYDCETGIYYRGSTATVDSTIHVRLTMMDCFSDTAEHSVDVTVLAGLTPFRTGTSYPRTVRVFLDKDRTGVYLMCRGTPTGTSTAVYKVVKLSMDGTQVLGQWSITDGTAYVYGSSCAGGAAGDKLWWMLPSSTYRGYSRYTCDLASGAITVTEVALDESSGNLLRWDETVAYFWSGCFWYPRRDGYTPVNDGYSDRFLYGSPMFDLDSQAVHGLMPPSVLGKTPSQYHAGLSPLSSCNGQWVKTYYAAADTEMPFAYSCYAVPADTPDRPEGSAMTVTYELDITW